MVKYIHVTFLVAIEALTRSILPLYGAFSCLLRRLSYLLYKVGQPFILICMYTQNHFQLYTQNRFQLYIPSVHTHTHTHTTTFSCTYRLYTCVYCIWSVDPTKSTVSLMLCPHLSLHRTATPLQLSSICGCRLRYGRSTSIMFISWEVWGGCSSLTWPPPPPPPVTVSRGTVRCPVRRARVRSESPILIVDFVEKPNLVVRRDLLFNTLPRWPPPLQSYSPLRRDLVVPSADPSG